MSTTPLPRKPTGKLAFAYQTIAALEQARADLEAENIQLRASLEWIVGYVQASPKELTEAHRWLEIARAALEKKP